MAPTAEHAKKEFIDTESRYQNQIGLAIKVIDTILNSKFIGKLKKDQKTFLKDQKRLFKKALILHKKCFPQKFLETYTDEEFLAGLEESKKEFKNSEAFFLYLNFQRQMEKFNTSNFSKELEKLFVTANNFLKAKNRDEKSFQTLQSLVMTPVPRPSRILMTLNEWHKLKKETAEPAGETVITCFAEFNTHINERMTILEKYQGTSKGTLAKLKLLEKHLEKYQGTSEGTLAKLKLLEKYLEEYQGIFKHTVEKKEGPLRPLMHLLNQVEKTLAIVKLGGSLNNAWEEIEEIFRRIRLVMREEKARIELGKKHGIKEEGRTMLVLLQFEIVLEKIKQSLPPPLPENPPSPEMQERHKVLFSRNKGTVKQTGGQKTGRKNKGGGGA